MKSYLSLIPISARANKTQNRLTLLCIILAVFLVTAIFSMTEMGLRMEKARLLSKHSNLTVQDLFEMGQSLFPMAAVLFILILIAGVLMISSSMNSTVAQRTRFFGMMRCIGMSRSQIIRFVKLEALNWCTTAIPIGVLLGILATWGLCAVMRLAVGEEFSNIPLFGISGIGIFSGILLGVVTVFIAAGAPAKRAARVSPITAVSGNSEGVSGGCTPVKARALKIETALGIQLAVASKKNLWLMIGSFAVSILLFLSFSVLIDFVGYLLPQSYGAPDITVHSPKGANTIDSQLLDTIGGMEGVKHVYGRRSLLDVAQPGNQNSALEAIDMVSFDAFDLDGLTKDRMLKGGSDIAKVYGDSHYVLATGDQESRWEIGDTIQIGAQTVEIAGLLKHDPFNSDGRTGGKITLITSDKTFERLTGETNYALLMIQTTKSATQENIKAIQDAVGDSGVFRDRRDQRTAGTYRAFVLCVYGFLSIILLIAVLNIMNSISMSVSARIKQYGAMRAVGMTVQQLTRMIAAQAATYALLGCAVGCVVGLPVSRLLYETLITAHFRYAVWQIPVIPLLLSVLFVFVATVLAIYTPAKRIQKLSVVATINDW